MIRAYLFDLDGTLLDSEPIHKKSEVEVFARFGLTIVPDDLKPYMGLTLRDMLARMNERFGTSIEEEAFRKHSVETLGRLVETELEVFQDALSIIPGLDVQCAIVTSSSRWYVDVVQAKFRNFFRYFETIITADDVKEGKPAPEPFLQASKYLRLPAESCVAIEDSPNGVLSAKAAGCQTWHVCRSVTPHPDADKSAESLSELFAS